MILTVKTYIDDEDLEIVGERFFIDGEEICEDCYLDLLEDLNLEEDYKEPCDGDCENCQYGCEEDDCNYEYEDSDEEFELYESKLDFINDILDNYGEINLITDYETAKEIVSELGIYDYDDYISIDLQSDVESYLITIIDEKSFIVEPVKQECEYPLIECEELIIDEDVIDLLEDEFYMHLNVEDISYLEYDEFIEDECRYNCKECNDCSFCNE